MTAVPCESRIPGMVLTAPGAGSSNRFPSGIVQRGRCPAWIIAGVKLPEAVESDFALAQSLYDQCRLRVLELLLSVKREGKKENECHSAYTEQHGARIAPGFNRIGLKVISWISRSRLEILHFRQPGKAHCVVGRALSKPVGATRESSGSRYTAGMAEVKMLPSLR